MGLDITYYAEARRLRDPVDEDDGWGDDETRLWMNPDFPERADGLTDGVYAVSGGDGFAAGGYIGFGHWREQLAKAAGLPALDVPEPKLGDPNYLDDMTMRNMPHCAAVWRGVTTSGPFVELINFSDCEGTIGPVTSAKLAADFAQHQAAADALGGVFADRYAKWRAAFETASRGGAVKFH